MGATVFDLDDDFVRLQGLRGAASLAEATTVLRDLAKHHARFVGAVLPQLPPLSLPPCAPPPCSAPHRL
jgi:hypothetical protein